MGVCACACNSFMYVLCVFYACFMCVLCVCVMRVLCMCYACFMHGNQQISKTMLNHMFKISFLNVWRHLNYFLSKTHIASYFHVLICLICWHVVGHTF